MLGLDCIYVCRPNLQPTFTMPAIESGVLPDDEMQRKWNGSSLKRFDYQGNYDDNGNVTHYWRSSYLSCHYSVCHAANAGDATRVPWAKSKDTL